MSVDDEKVKNGTSLFYSVEIFPNKCKFTTDDAFDKRSVTINQTLTDSYTGIVNLTGDTAFFSNSNPYLKIDDELMKVDISVLSPGFDFNGSNNYIDIPNILSTGDFEFKCNININDKSPSRSVIFSGLNGFEVYITNGDAVAVDYPLSIGGTFTIFGDFVQYGVNTELRVRKTGTFVTVTLNGVSFFNADANADSLDLNKIGSDQLSSDNFLGNIGDFKFYNGGDELTGTLVRNMPIDDGFASDPVISELISSQDGTVFNALSSNWPPSSGQVSVIIIVRGALGTLPDSHSVGPALILHSGEADGSCYGFPRLPNGTGCSSPDSFDKDTELSMLFPSTQLTDGATYFNGLDLSSLSHKPTIIKPGESIATRAGFSCTLIDNTDEDVYTVPYPERRTGNATLFKKLLARHPHLENRRLIFRSGFIENGVVNNDNVYTREYIIDKANLTNGKFSISGLDPLILSEASKSKLPIKSNGVLEDPITNISTQINVKDFAGSEYGSNTDSITVRIDKELISCTINDAVTGVFDIVSRAVQSEEADHKVNASVQLCIKLENFNPVETIEDFWRAGTAINDKFYDDYSTAIAATTNATGPIYITTPTPVEKLVNEIIRSWSANGLAVYYSETQQKIKIKAASDFSQQPLTINYKTQIERDTMKIDRNVKNQYTRATTSFARINSGEKPSEDNSSITFTSIGADVELTGLLEPNSKKDFVTRFLTNSDTDVAIAVAGTSRIININKEVPKKYTFKIDYESYGNLPSGVVEEAEIINVTTNDECDMDGNDSSINVQILSLKDNAPDMTYTATCERYQDIILEEDFDFIIDEDKEDYDLSSEFAPVGAGQYTVFIKSGVTIGATSTAVNAFTTGTQSAGVTFKFTIRSSILAAGGNGATTSPLLIPNPNDFLVPGQTNQGVDGLVGGSAFNATVDCEIDISQGVIYAGGGGAPSSDSYGQNTPTVIVDPGNGGSGGQGYIGGTGGSGGFVRVESIISETAPDGVDGSRATPGSLAGVFGGAWGSDSDEISKSGNKGVSGFAIKSNGNSVIMTGDNELTVRGRRS